MVVQEADGVLDNDIYNDIPDSTPNDISKSQSLDERLINNAEVEIPQYRKQLLESKEHMLSCANMYQQDYLDKVEERSLLASEAKEKAVLSLLDVSKRICSLAECFNRLIDDQAEKLQEIENLATTATASLETISCHNFRQDLSSRVPMANIPPRQHRIGRPESMETDFLNKKVVWEKLNYNKLDSVGAGGVETAPEEVFAYNDIPSVNPPSKAPSQLSINSNTSSQVTSSLQSPTLSSARLTASSVDVTRDPMSPGLNRYGSTSSINSSKSLRIMPARAAPAPPPSKAKAHRTRVYSVKNETGEGLDKPSIPPPTPPSPEESHYATPPMRMMPTVSEEESRGATPTPNAIYEQALPNMPAAPPAPVPAAPSQYQTIAIAGPPVSNDDIYVDYDDSMPPPPSDIMPPPLPANGGDDDYIYADTNSEIVSKDSGFYTEDQDDDDVIDKVEAIYPYAATANDELNLNIGDIVAVHVKNPDGWFEGTLNGVRGLFPGNYVQHVG